jgi:WD40 repeat protein
MSGTARAAPKEAAIDPIEAAVASCVVIVEGRVGGSRGTGFFVAPNLVATCAHVAGTGPVMIRFGAFEDTKAEVVDVELPLADIALVRTSLSANDVDHSGARRPGRGYVALGFDTPALECEVASLGFPERARQPHWDRVQGRVEQLDHQHPDARWRDGTRLIKFRDALVVPGFSGAPLLNLETGLVVGVVTTTLDASNNLGGLALPAVLLGQVKEVLAAQDAIAPLDVPCPYPGLRAFGAGDTEFFFGRDEPIAEVIQALHSLEPQILIVGSSGSGKSSLIAAGIMPAIRRRMPQTLVLGPIRLTTAPAQNFAAALGLSGTDVRGRIDVLLEQHGAEHLVVCIDQLEELFTQASPVQVREFVELYSRFRLAGRGSVIYGLRADFYDKLLESALWEHLAGRHKRLDLASLKGLALTEVIEGPARRVFVTIDRQLTRQLIQDAACEPGPLPLLQVALRSLWDQPRRGRWIELSAYASADPNDPRTGLAKAIERHAGAALHQLSLLQQSIARRIFLRLVHSEGRTTTRRQQTLSALRVGTDNEAEFDAVYKFLVEDARLLTATKEVDPTDPRSPIVVDLAHESLIWAWSEFARWIEVRALDWFHRSRLEDQFDDWKRLGEGRTGLLDEIELAEAEQWLQGEGAQEIGYRTEVRDLIAKSRTHVEEQKRREVQRTRVAVLALSVFALVVTALGLFAWSARNDAEEGRKEAEERRNDATQKEKLLREQLASTRLEQGRELLLAGSPMHALPFLVAALEGQDGPALRTLLAGATRVPVATLWHQDFVTSVQFSPDSTRVVTASENKTARVWDAHTGKPLTPALEHQGSVNSAQFSPDGTRVVTASLDKTARVWDAHTGKPLTPALEHQGFVISAQFSADGTRVVTASKDKTARVWDAHTGKPLTPALKHQGFVTSAQFSPDGTRVVTASDDNTARVWDAHTGKLLTPALEHQDSVWSAQFSPDSTRVVTASRDNTARVWDAHTGKPLTPALEHQGIVWSAQFSADGTRVVTASKDKTARVWDAHTGKPLTPALEHQGSVNSAQFSPDGTRVVTASLDKTARVWDAHTGKPLTPALEHQGFVTSAQFSPDSTRVVTASRDKAARVWDAHTGKPLTPALEHQSSVNSVQFSADGTRVVTASDDNTARVWDAYTGKPLTPALEHQGIVSSAQFSPDSKRVVTASWDKTARVWDAHTGKPLTPALEHQGIVSSAQFSPDGKRVVTASRDKTVRVWDSHTGKPLTLALEHQGIVTSAQFSPDGARVITASLDKTARVWDAHTGKPLTPALEHQGIVTSAQFSPDGKRVVTASRDKTARVWDAHTGKPLTPALEHQKYVLSAQFSPDGTRVVTASDDDTARVWDAHTGKPLTPALEHQGFVTSAQFSPDGTRVVTASEDKTARVWDAHTGKPLTPALEHQGIVTSAQFSPDGTRVVTASSDGTARVWDVPVDRREPRKWHQLASCAPFVLVDGLLESNQTPSSTCPMQ